MSQESSFRTTALLTFFGGLAFGALVVALTTPKPGAQVRRDLAGLGRRMKNRAGDIAQRGTRAWEVFKEHAEQGGEAAGQVAADLSNEIRVR